MKRFTIKTISKALLFTTVLGTASCNKFLQETDPSNLTPETFYTLPEHAEAAIAAVYADLRFVSGGAGIFANNVTLPEALSGLSRTETGQNSDLNNLVGLSYTGENAFFVNWWNGLYRVVAQSNQVLARVPEINPMDEAAKNRVLGQARFMRAWAYFHLVQMWGDVPLITEPVTGTSENLYPSRAAVADIYQQIVADLTAAESTPLPWTDNTGRASMGAVKGILARVYLTMAGHPLNLGTSHYALAAAKAKEVIDNGSFSLFTSYHDLHSLATKNRGEHMFMIQYLAGVAENGIQAIMLPNFKGVSSYGTEVGSHVPVPEFVDTYEAGDKRTVDREGFYYTSYYDEGNGPLKALGAPYIFKHFDVIANGTSGVPGTNLSSMNWPLLRYAEVLLTYAEAQNESEGAPSADAVDALKLIRDRAGLTTLAAGGYTQATFREAVRRERWHELAYENITWFDMLRLRQAFNVNTRSFEPLVGHAFPDNGAIVQERHLLLPLPTNEMRNNPNLTPNNPGY